MSTLTHTEPEAIEGMSVDAIQLANQSDGKLHHVPYLGMLPLSVLKQHIIQQPHYDSSFMVFLLLFMITQKACWLLRNS